MKRVVNLSRFLAVATLALATIGIFSTPNTALAERGGSMKLMRIETAQDLSKVEPGDTIIMSCPKCKDTYVTIVDKSYKGKPDEKTGIVHLCPMCETKVVFTGEGKAAKDKLVHTCKMCGSQDVTCCLMKKGGAPTEGMEQK